MGRLIPLIITILSISIGGMLFIGRSLPESPRLAMLRLNDCALPCWIGIVPGVTPLNEAEARIYQVYVQPEYTVQREREGLHVIRNSDGADLWIGLETLGDIVRRMTLSERDDSSANPTIGELTVALGIPSRKIANPDLGDARILRFTSRGIDAWLDTWDAINLACDSVAVFRRVPFLVIDAAPLVNARPERVAHWGGFDKCHHLVP